jgi:hypothetical protein
MINKNQLSQKALKAYEDDLAGNFLEDTQKELEIYAEVACFKCELDGKYYLYDERDHDIYEDHDACVARVNADDWLSEMESSGAFLNDRGEHGLCDFQLL